MWSLPTLVLLIFTVVVRTTVPPPPTVLNRTLLYPHPPRYPRANTPLMRELLGTDDGIGKRTLKAYDGKRYLTEFHGDMVARVWSGARGQHWYIEQINDNEVALRSFNGAYISQWWFIYTQPHSSATADEKAMLTPVKNDDGSWSFKTRGGKWLSAHKSNNYISLEPENKRCERWKPESW